MTKLLGVSILISISICLMSASCRETGNRNSMSDTLSINDGIDGTVTLKYLDDGCAILISVVEDDNEIFYIPVQLGSKYKVEGLKISFTSHPSRINQGNCLMGSPIIIDSIMKR